MFAMHRKLLAAVGCALLVTAWLTPSTRLIAQTSGEGLGEASVQNANGQELAYGSDDLQRLDFWPGSSATAPLIMFVHGGGWKRGDKSMMRGSDKLSHWQAAGYAVASLNYRLVPDNTVEQQARDVASAVAFLQERASTLGFGSDKIVLVGHSAGAHLVTLVGTDPTYLRAAGLTMNDVAGILALDGAGYNVPDQMDENPRLMGATYRQAFGTDPARQRALSPTLHAAAPNAPDFLFVHVQRDDAQRQSTQLAAALNDAGTTASVHGIGGRGLRGHRQINTELGDPDYPATAIVDTWLARILDK